ncbi:uncharacterized protein EI90DRAFT_1304376 [Cantharellus anzutake]|uniref:uncharacterized protein n=1 Tax=Cantharellus anzutake TaxID=1750568 RepID=UPI00190368A1|nr:uncharacterized protein EI90DRAFT_1304376 [Cantharellus anzutake]KAF8342130.1 hypothetical protein EI90DRAFT_1304376 [Cantharellus anzutake]
MVPILNFRYHERLLVLGSNSRTSSGDLPRGEQATNQLLVFFRRSLPPCHLRDKNSDGFIGTKNRFPERPTGFSGAAGDRRGRIDFSSLRGNKRGSPTANYPEISQGGTHQWAPHRRMQTSNSDDDDSDLGVPLGSATPTLTSSRNYVNRYSPQRLYTSSPERAEPGHVNHQQKSTGKEADEPRGVDDSDEDEDYGQVVVIHRFLKGSSSCTDTLFQRHL